MLSRTCASQQLNLIGAFFGQYCPNFLPGICENLPTCRRETTILSSVICAQAYLYLYEFSWHHVLGSALGTPLKALWYLHTWSELIYVGSIERMGIFILLTFSCGFSIRKLSLLQMPSIKNIKNFFNKTTFIFQWHSCREKLDPQCSAKGTFTLLWLPPSFSAGLPVVKSNFSVLH